ncbi:MAG: hypothetical protein F6K23_16070 [Okeania sp. SIO2C9]|uniref:hypothetical protein n=1 Tax=Okeania sp. SIO2C9 TaxID=2607791 RepID=UPI0013C27ED4|nr:hypothetical protein [Okeania sp. SIO2C9]NEQ74412.1 hypothetical protein [Okeania sp. SIO2C9]
MPKNSNYCPTDELNINQEKQGDREGEIKWLVSKSSNYCPTDELNINQEKQGDRSILSKHFSVFRDWMFEQLLFFLRK